MDFNKMIGKQVMWAGEFTDSEGCVTKYILFSDRSGLAIADPSVDDGGPLELQDAPDTLGQIVEEKLPEAQSVIKLSEILNGWKAVPAVEVPDANA